MGWLKQRLCDHIWERRADIRPGPTRRYMFVPIACAKCGREEMTWKADWADGVQG